MLDAGYRDVASIAIRIGNVVSSRAYLSSDTGNLDGTFPGCGRELFSRLLVLHIHDAALRNYTLQKYLAQDLTYNRYLRSRASPWGE